MKLIINIVTIAKTYFDADDQTQFFKTHQRTIKIATKVLF